MKGSPQNICNYCKRYLGNKSRCADCFMCRDWLCSQYFEWYWGIMFKLKTIPKKMEDQENKNREQNKENKKRYMFHWGEVQNALFWEVASLEISKSNCLITWETSEKKTSYHISFHFLTISFCLSKFLNSHSGRRHWIRHSQGLWRSLKMDTCWSAKNLTRTIYCTKRLHHTYTKIWTLSCGGISEHHGIFLERKKHTTLYKSWLSPSRGDF